MAALPGPLAGLRVNMAARGPGLSPASRRRGGSPVTSVTGITAANAVETAMVCFPFAGTVKIPVGTTLRTAASSVQEARAAAASGPGEKMTTVSGEVKRQPQGNGC